MLPVVKAKAGSGARVAAKFFVFVLSISCFAKFSFTKLKFGRIFVKFEENFAKRETFNKYI